jgi:hypothetical protein
LADLERQAESTPAFRAALRAFEQQRQRVVLQAVAAWLVVGAALFAGGRAFLVNDSQQRPRADR